MSSHNQNENTAASPSFVSIVLILTFFITLGIMSFGNFPTPVIETDDETSIAVAEVATDSPLPTETSLPPTETVEEPTSLPTNTPTAVPTATIEPTSEPSSVEDDTASTTGTDYDPDVVSHGESLFVACAACHGPEGLGVPNLGKNLVESEFVHSLSDDELVDFIKTGRPIWDPLNTTGIDMPPKGGNPTLTDDDLYAIVAYVRNLSSPLDSGNALEATPINQVNNENNITNSYNPDIVEHGESLFIACAACHGPEGLGVPNLGKNLVESEFVHSLSDDELVDFIKTGRPIWDPLNTTGVDMPPKGGNPTLTDDDLYAIVIYLRSLSE